MKDALRSHAAEGPAVHCALKRRGNPDCGIPSPYRVTPRRLRLCAAGNDPHLTRSPLHRLFQRHGISRLPGIDGPPPRRQLRTYPLGYIHIDLAEVWTEEGKLHWLVAIDRVSKFAFADLHEQASRRVAADVLRRLVERVPYRVHTALTDNGCQFTPPEGGWTVAQIHPTAGRRTPLSRPRV